MVMTIARRELKVKVRLGQTNAVGPTSIEGSFSSLILVTIQIY